jgi:hypothetical protein
MRQQLANMMQASAVLDYLGPRILIAHKLLKTVSKGGMHGPTAIRFYEINTPWQKQCCQMAEIIKQFCLCVISYYEEKRCK